MNPGLEGKLFKDFPSMFTNWTLGPHLSAMYFGVECGDGWEPLIRTFCEQFNGRVKFDQIKEKFGSLRMYHTAVGCDEDIGEKAWSCEVFAERMSTRICEECGRPGELRTNGWHRTLCDACENKRQREMRGSWWRRTKRFLRWMVRGK